MTVKTIPTIAALFLSFTVATFTLPSWSDDFSQRLAAAAAERTQHAITYDGRYFQIPYPNGDIPSHLGVCTDVIIRSYRALGFDLQQHVHEDMQAHFQKYPAYTLWQQTKPDRNIDHRRVPNLETYFQRHGESLTTDQAAIAYLPGDIVSWRLNGKLPHIGIVSDQQAADGTPLIIHNIGAGPVLESVLFAYPIFGHFRFRPK